MLKEIFPLRLRVLNAINEIDLLCKKEFYLKIKKIIGRCAI